MIGILINCLQAERGFWVGPEIEDKVTQASMQVTQSLRGYMHESSGSALAIFFNAV